MTKVPPRSTSNPTSEVKAAAPADTWTLVAIAAVAYGVASVIHEGIGHGGACLLSGGHAVALSTVHFECSGEGRFVAGGGTIANLIAGLIFWLASRMVTRATRLRYFLWLSMTVNLLEAGGYFLFSGVGNIGDWAVIIRGLEPAWCWRVGLAVLGACSYLLIVWVALLEMRPFVGHRGPEMLQRAKKLCLTSYLAGGILYCVAGVFNPVGVSLVLISAAAASFGGTSGLAWMWEMFKGNRIPEGAFEMPPLARSGGWLAGAAILEALFIAVLGPGLKFR
jgi:hypothetical protein